MPKNTIIPAAYGGGVVPPIAEQSIRFDRTRATLLHGYSPADDLASDLWTVSGWFKITSDQNFTTTLWSARQDANNFTQLQHNGFNNLHFQAQIGGVIRAEFRTARRIIDGGNWYHIMVVFGRTIGQLDLFVNGYLWPDSEMAIVPTIDNVAGYSWFDSSADHAIGGIATPADHFSGEVAELHGTVNGEAVTAFGQFNSAGVWEPITYIGVHGSQGFHLTFGRTADLGEDFSGNANDFPTHDNGGALDQMDDWMERNYCVIDVHNNDTLGGVSEAGLELTAANGRVTMQPAPNTGVWYYERNGVAVTFDTAGGRFNPLLTPATYNFGQRPFMDVGPGGGELTLVSPNLPASDILISRDFFAAIGYEGDGVNPRTIASPAVSQGDAEYADIKHQSDLVWVKNMSNNTTDHQQAHRLRTPPAVVFPNDIALESASEVQGIISDLLATGFEVDAGGSGDDNVNDLNDLISAVSWRCPEQSMTIPVIQSSDDGDERDDTTAVDIVGDRLETRQAGNPSRIGLRFQNVLIPQGATILEARVQFTSSAAQVTVPADFEVFCEDIDDAPTFAAVNGNISGRTPTSAVTPWVIPAWAVGGDRLAAQLTPDFATSVKEVVDRGSWAPGNSLVVIVAYDGVGGFPLRRASSFDDSGDIELAPELQVRWIEGTTKPGVALFTYQGLGFIREVMHGLDAAPGFIAIKRATGAASSWRNFHEDIATGVVPTPEEGYIAFNLTGAAVNDVGVWDDTAPGATKLTLGADLEVNALGNEYVGWCMREVEGFSKVFAYTGDGSSTGPSVYCGFKARFILIKNVEGASGWFFHHRAMGIAALSNGIYNEMSGNMLLNSATGALQSDGILVLSHGIRIVDAGGINDLNEDYVGIAFAESPFKQAKAAP